MVGAQKASIVIPTFRRHDRVRSLLGSLSGQKTGYAFEVIVVNDDPENDLRGLETEFKDFPLKVINLSQDHGRSIARNTGVRGATGDILIFLDDDMTVAEGFVTSHMEAYTGQEIAVIGNVLSAPEYAADPFARYIERQGVKKRKPTEEIPPQCFRTGNASLPRSTFDAVGMFDESLRTYGEDLDLAMRLHYRGVRFVFAPGAVSYNHDPPDIDDMMNKIREWGRYTLPLFAKRHPQLTRALWVHLADPLALGRENPATSLKKVGLRIALIRPFYELARLIYRFKWLGRLLFPVIDYIRVYNYVGAYRQSITDHPTKIRASPDYPQTSSRGGGDISGGKEGE